LLSFVESARGFLLAATLLYAALAGSSTINGAFLEENTFEVENRKRRRTATAAGKAGHPASPRRGTTEERNNHVIAK
jgi:hypothetical protein